MTSDTAPVPDAAALPGPATPPRLGPSGRSADPRAATGGVVGLVVLLAAAPAAAVLQLAGPGTATFAAWLVLVLGLVAWSPVSRRWPRAARLGPAVAVGYLAVGASFLLAG
ncbi:MAG: hypothetical protein H5T83_04780 [Actinotalea sp.]|nr:hypothetical protein [Actinotalea sp.]